MVSCCKEKRRKEIEKQGEMGAKDDEAQLNESQSPPCVYHWHRMLSRKASLQAICRRASQFFFFFLLQPDWSLSIYIITDTRFQAGSSFLHEQGIYRVQFDAAYLINSLFAHISARQTWPCRMTLDIFRVECTSRVSKKLEDTSCKKMK